MLSVSIFSSQVHAEEAQAVSGKEGLVAHYTFDTGKGDVLPDVSGNGNNGKIHGATWVKSPRGQALRFDGVDDYVDCGDSPAFNLRGDITIMARVKADDLGDGFHFIFADSAESVQNHNYSLFLEKGRLCFRNGDDYSPWVYQSAIKAEKPFPVGSWQTLVMLFEGNRYWIYLNGHVVEQGDSSLPITPTHGGNRHLGGFRGRAAFRGDIDEFRLYNRALSQKEILGLDLPAAVESRQIFLNPRLKYTAQQLDCEAIVLGDLPSGSRVELSARDLQQDRQVGKAELNLVGETSLRSGRWQANGKLSTATWAAGKHEITVRICDATDKETGRSSVMMDYPGPNPEYPGGKPKWLHGREGLSDKVQPPFTPLLVDRNATGCRISPWGRRYDFSQSPFLAQIISKDTAMLAGPMRLLATVDGKDIRWKQDSTQLADAGETLCRVEQTLACGSVNAKVSVTVESDGLAKFDWALSSKTNATIDRLVVEIPFRKEVVRYLNTWPRVTSGAFAESYASPFQPLVWLGDEYRGLQWVCESQRNWSVAQADRAIEIVRQGDEVVLRLNLVTKPVTLAAGEKRDYSFGLQASPVKPIGQDAWDTRIVRTPWYGKELDLPDQKVGNTPALEYYAAKGVRAIVIWRWWDAFADPRPIGHEDKFRRLVAECHRHGIKVLPYVGGFLLSELTPEAPFFGDEMRVTPMQLYRSTATASLVKMWPGWKAQMCLFACQRGPWQDFLVDGVAHLMDEYDVDGVYLDTTTVPFPCRNELHGCGYRDADGKAEIAYPVFSVRDNIRRIYTAVKQRKPDGIVDMHVYDCMNLPGLAWATTYWNGEALPKDKKSKLESLPLDRFRAEFMGYNWGVPADLLYYVIKNYQNSLALALLHDVPVRPEKLEDLKVLSSLWQIRDRFGVKQARWLPYWSNQDAVTAAPKDCHASLFVHPDGRVLVYVSNLGKTAADVRLSLSLYKLALPANVIAKDAISKAAVKMENGVITLNIPAQDYRVIWVAAGGPAQLVGYDFSLDIKVSSVVQKITPLVTCSELEATPLTMGSAIKPETIGISTLGKPAPSLFINGKSLDVKSEQDAVKGNNYLSFTITPKSGAQMAISGFSFDLDRSDDQAVTSFALYAENAGQFEAVATGKLSKQFGNSSEDFITYQAGLDKVGFLQSVTKSITFKLYLYGSSFTGKTPGNVRLDNVIIYGKTNKQ